MRIWVVTDGRAGNENPALGLAEAVSAKTVGDPGADIEVKRIAPRAGFASLPARVWAAGVAARGASGAGADATSNRRRGWPFIGLRDRGASLDGPAPDLVIGAGRRSAPIVAALRDLGEDGRRRTTAVQLLNPQMQLSAFDLVITPQHDRLVGPNVHETIGSLHRMTPARLAVHDPRLDHLPRPMISVLLGGPSRSARFDPTDLERLLRALQKTADAGAGVAVTASRRTPSAWLDQVRAGLPPDRAWIWGGSRATGANPLYAMLGAADAIVVTADSANMASEACSIGKPVFVAPLTRLAPKLARFHAALREGGHARGVEDLALGGSTFGGPARGALAYENSAGAELISDWSPKPLDDMTLAASAVVTVMGLDSCPVEISD